MSMWLLRGLVALLIPWLVRVLSNRTRQWHREQQHPVPRAMLGRLQLSPQLPLLLFIRAVYHLPQVLVLHRLVMGCLIRGALFRSSSHT